MHEYDPNVAGQLTMAPMVPMADDTNQGCMDQDQSKSQVYVQLIQGSCVYHLIRQRKGEEIQTFHVSDNV